jgi:hypothetical protein
LLNNWKKYFIGFQNDSNFFSGECKTQWHVRPGGDFKDEEEVSKHQGHNLLVNAASRVWEVKK